MDCVLSFVAPFCDALTSAFSSPASFVFAIAALIGGVSVFSTFVSVVSYFLSYVTALFGTNFPKKYGPWAVVTGATDGIGLAYAHQLAKKGMNVVLISRTESRLLTAAEEISAAYPNIDTKIIVADFGDSVESGLYDRIREELSGLEIGVLINNVGMSYPGALFFDELDTIDPNLIQKLIALNVVSTTQMTRIVVSDMKKRKKGAIINIASAAGRLPIGNPLYAVYSASKAYVDYFSRSLHHELKQHGVHVQCQSPYFVTSKLSKLRHPSLTTPTPKKYVAAAVAAIGSGDSVVPYLAHTLQDTILRSLPSFILSPIILSMHLGLRARFMKKRTDKRD